MVGMRNLVWLLAVGFFLLNPNFACGGGEPEFQYGATEMRRAVEGDWTLTITPTGGTATQVVVHVAQGSAVAASLAPRARRGGLVGAVYACGTRTLVRSAGACIDVSQMPLAVSYVSGDASFASASMSGTFSVHSLVFASGELELRVGPYEILSEVNADGSLVDPHLGSLGTNGTLVVTRG